MSSNFSLNPTTPWTYIWESQSHTPTLRLLIFNSRTIPKRECKDLQIRLLLEESLVLVTWVGDNDDLVLIRVPIPRRVLLDVEASPLSFKVADDHIEVKLVLLLPVNHPIVLNFNEDNEMQQPLSVDSDLSALSSGKAVDFFCRSCSTKLTVNPISCFVEMPSTDWRESADNWFGGCCCSFGGVSEKLVTGYANSYSSVMGKCLVNSTSVVVCKVDLLEYLVPDGENNGKDEYYDIYKRKHQGLNKVDLKSVRSELTGDNLLKQCPLMKGHENLLQLQPCSERKCAGGAHTVVESHTACLSITSECSSVGEGLKENYSPDQKFLLNGLLGNIFMIRSSHLSKLVEWNEVLCPKCSSLLGAYPSYVNGNEPLDGWIRFFKYCISTSSQHQNPSNVFRNYTLERMFTNQLLESANDELMFRTLVRDLKSKAPALQIVMLNPNSWSYSGYCSAAGESVSNIELRPVLKVLFSHSIDFTGFQSRQMSNWVRNNDADEVHMLTEQIRELTYLLEAGKASLPSSCAYLQGLPLSSLHR